MSDDDDDGAIELGVDMGGDEFRSVAGDDVDVEVEDEFGRGEEPGEGKDAMSPVVDVEADVGK